MKQPQIEPTAKPCIQYLMDDVYLDVWTGEYAGRITIEGVAVAGTRVDITNILSSDQLEAISLFCEANVCTTKRAMRDFAEEMAMTRYAA